MNYIRHLNIFFDIATRDKALKPAHISLYMAFFQYWNQNRFLNPFPVNRDTAMGRSKIGSKSTYHKCLKELHHAGYIFYHPGKSRFEAVKISIVRLDEISENPDSIQLDIFSKIDGSQCPNNETYKAKSSVKNGTVSGPDLIPSSVKNGTVPGPDLIPSSVKNGTVPGPDLIPSSVKNGTVPGPDMGHSYKLNYKTINSVCNTPTKIFIKNDFLNEEIGGLIQDAAPPKFAPQENTFQPTLSEVQTFFREYNYPVSEAEKFFYYNEGKAWMFTPQMKIRNWQSLARKWILNTHAYKSSEVVKSQNKLNNDKDYGEPL